MLGITLTNSASNEAKITKHEKPVLALAEDPETLTHSYLIRQSCALSFEASSCNLQPLHCQLKSLHFHVHTYF